jgi:hypothetical protein
MQKDVRNSELDLAKSQKDLVDAEIKVYEAIVLIYDRIRRPKMVQVDRLPFIRIWGQGSPGRDRWENPQLDLPTAAYGRNQTGRAGAPSDDDS